jgi:hypothetical protein
MLVKLFHRGIVLGLALGAIILLDNPANAQGRGDGGGSRGGDGGGMGGFSGGANLGGVQGGAFMGGGQTGVGIGTNGGARIGGNVQEGFRGQVEGRANLGVNSSNWDRGRGDWNRGRGDWNRWDRNYYSYYGRGWDYRPDFGWGINVPLGRFGGIGIGNYYGNYGYPYYGWGNWNYWGPDGYYGSWGPGYDTYSYDYSAPAYSAQPDQQYAQDQQTQDQLPPMPTSKELSRFTDQQLQSFIAWVANGFTRELKQFGTGDTWVIYFRLNDLKAFAPNAPGAAADAQASDIATKKSRNVIDDVLNRMDSASKNDEYKSVTNTWGFQALHVALKEANQSPDERGPAVLKGQAEVLSKSLDNLSTGEGWRKHLDIDAIEKLADKKKLESNDEIKGIAEKFEHVSRNHEYQAIAQLPGFYGVYSTLNKIVGGKETQSTAKRDPSPPEKTRD